MLIDFFTREEQLCAHPARRLYAWYAGSTLCICCCECGAVLKGGS